ncbi:EexN family lipoprotein [Campylobacter upsaliensis]|uniref:EexN family lipoprotein n=1 Tax=Campylobacter upsaliensis TaxID=28080 RepID=UPI0013AB0CE3|nr:EexN family lipoprotein [Campylobacter upsaliensis]EGK8046782.1 EexN family lipoprotein [Campylobacter upsaliensis]MEB2802447.1 EexN family lipoprotein [Campylobacter upsaliensis]MEB2824726.1 EexN family lipoprotein [Campylobacter upsaliensis]MEB2826658.1 EexN family lipoprotein [Campylobacter upsaliensis]HEF3575103.1 EexN family lipoprotein [Campylobacter upsaliensis]
MKNVIKLGLLSAVVATLFSACSSEPKSVQYYEDPKNAKELEAKIQECDKNANSAKTDTECANAYKARYSKSLQNFQNTKITDEEIKKHFKHRDNK